jgi:hypothetical protein
VIKCKSKRRQPAVDPGVSWHGTVVARPRCSGSVGDCAGWSLVAIVESSNDLRGVSRTTVCSGRPNADGALCRWWIRTMGSSGHGSTRGVASSEQASAARCARRVSGGRRSRCRFRASHATRLHLAHDEARLRRAACLGSTRLVGRALAPAACQLTSGCNGPGGIKCKSKRRQPAVDPGVSSFLYVAPWLHSQH